MNQSRQEPPRGISPTPPNHFARRTPSLRLLWHLLIFSRAFHTDIHFLVLRERLYQNEDSFFLVPSAWPVVLASGKLLKKAADVLPREPVACLAGPDTVVLAKAQSVTTWSYLLTCSFVTVRRSQAYSEVTCPSRPLQHEWFVDLGNKHSHSLSSLWQHSSQRVPWVCPEAKGPCKKQQYPKSHQSLWLNSKQVVTILCWCSIFFLCGLAALLGIWYKLFPCCSPHFISPLNRGWWTDLICASSICLDRCALAFHLPSKMKQRKIWVWKKLVPPRAETPSWCLKTGESPVLYPRSFWMPCYPNSALWFFYSLWITPS